MAKHSSTRRELNNIKKIHAYSSDNHKLSISISSINDYNSLFSSDSK